MVFTGCPTAPISLPCDSAPTCATVAALGIMANDVCEGPITPICTAGPVVSSGNQSSQIFTLIATDACGNSETCLVTYTWSAVCPTNCCEGCTTNDYVSYTVTIYPGANLLARNLCHGTNDVLEELTPFVSDGDSVLTWDGHQYGDPINYVSGDGWLDGNADPATLVVAPGGGYVFNSSRATPYNITFTGCEPMNCAKPCEPTNTYRLVGRIGLGSPTHYSDLFSCPLVCGTHLSRFDPSLPGFKDYYYDYVNGWTPSEPSPRRRCSSGWRATRRPRVGG